MGWDYWAKKTAHSLPIGHEWDVMRLCRSKKGSVIHLLFLMQWGVMRLLDRKKGRITDILFVIAWHMIRLPGRKNGGAVTDSLFVGMEFLVMRLPSKKWQCHWHSVGPNVIRLPGRKQMVVSLTRCLSWDFNWWDYLAKRGQCHTLPVGNVIRPVHDRRRGHFHSQAVALDKMRWVCLAERKGLTHKLLAMGWKVMQPES